MSIKKEPVQYQFDNLTIRVIREYEDKRKLEDILFKLITLEIQKSEIIVEKCKTSNCA